MRHIAILTMISILIGLISGCATVSNKDMFRVRTAEELIDAIGPDRTIILDPKEFVISGLSQSSRSHVIWQNVHDGDQIVVQNLRNLRICTEGDKPASILVAPRYAYALSFKNCKDVSLVNVAFGHTKEKGYCTGGVLSFTRCENVVIQNTTLHGSGHEGLTVADSTNLSFVGSTIRDCTYGIMSLSDSSNIHFQKARFIDNQTFDLISIRHCEDVIFEQCEILRNQAGWDGEETECSLFNISSSSGITVRDSLIQNNSLDYLLNREGTMSFTGSDIRQNTLRVSRYKYYKQE